ncbi:hypothetical protein BU15DRAFT_77984 [Melanogaster broomeanus]|nr:hypothetical protein BU15DRAFT_77984 [Melanogaster broomeanus]
MHTCLTPPPSSPHRLSPIRDAHREAPSSPYYPKKNVCNDTHIKVSTPGELRGGSDNGHPEDHPEGHSTQAVCVPPIVHRLSIYAKRARNKFTPYNRPEGPSPLELRFTEKLLGRVDSSEITLEDEREGKSIFLRGLMGLSDKAMHQALAARQADREAKRLRALCTAWEIEAADRHRNFLLTLHDHEIQQLNWAADDVILFEKILERRSIEELEDHMDFSTGAYGHDLRSLAVMDERLDQMGLEVSRRERGRLSTGEGETPDRLNAILAAAVSADSDETNSDETNSDEEGVCDAAWS